jgi:serine kinase of HPr protein (carbohydrate metabolism regulator)
LRLIDGGAQLIADDQTTLRSENGVVIASAPPSIAGLMEVRHVGLLRMPHTASAAIVLHIALVSLGENLERYPEPSTIDLLGCPIRNLDLLAFAASTPAKIRAVLKYPSATDD